MTERSCIPDAAAFARLALPGVAVPVVLELDGALTGLDPLATYELLARGERHAALLETADAGAGNAEVSIVVPRATLVIEGADVLDQAQRSCADAVADIGIDLPGFVGGAVGMLTHEHVTRLEPTVPVAAGAHPAGGPEAVFLLVDEFVIFEHRHDRVRAIHTVRVPEGEPEFDVAAAYRAATESLGALAARLEDVPSPEPTSDVRAAGEPVVAESNVTEERFLEMVRDAREQVRSGECVQIVVSQRFDRPFGGTAEDAYRALRDRGPAPYHVLMRLDELSIVGASPEQLVGVDGTRGAGRIVTHPIAGTRRRGATPAEDDLLATDLEGDPKERAEHMMLVDLGRNDVGRVSIPGSVEVTQLADVERFSHVMHLVSRVEGDLRPGLEPVDALRSCFPAGTLTGAPKVRAMQHIARLEPDRRGPYGGVVGYVGHGRMLDMAITIRTIVIAGGIASVQAGAGVVAASSARREYEETREKAAAALEALAAADARMAAAAGQDVEVPA
ncbi:MAG: anthranilate synthase component [Thermoleophilia bacterium]|nr:anthranilate synthase component [Thermoleophilia bacterium]